MITKPAQAQNIDDIIHRLRHLLPTQAPLKDFVHHNTLHAFQGLSFHEGVARASEIYQASGYMDPAWYQQKFREEIISEKNLRDAIFQFVDDAESADGLYQELLHVQGKVVRPRQGMRTEWMKRLGLQLDNLVHAQWIGLVSKYLDQGIAVWRMPHTSFPFLKAIRAMAEESFFPLVPLNSRACRDLLGMDENEAIEKCLLRLVEDPAFHETYLTEMALAHAGWSGMIAYVEDFPECLLTKRKISLRESIALELILEIGWLEKRLGPEFPKARRVEALPATDWNTLKIWQEAFERSQYDQALMTIAANKNRQLPVKRVPEIQAIFCIDEREGGIRRHLEELYDQVETYGSPGFYAVDFLFQGLDDGFPVQHCPVVIKPKHVVREAIESRSSTRPPHLNQLLHFKASSNTVFRGWLITQFLGVWSAVKMARHIFFPGASPAQATSLSQVNHHARLHLLRESDEPSPDGYLLGYSIQEMADRVRTVLESIGLTKNFARFVVAFAHGSSSANNPHFSAYDCGACAGKPGGANSRAFAQMANLSDVRKLLRDTGIDIPSTTTFVAGVHDTARDEVQYFDLDFMSDELRAKFSKFQLVFEKALLRNAQERCRRFELVDLKISEAQALKEVRRRSAAIFEPRPELNHATHYFGIVGRRDLTRFTFLDRRMFLNSYDPTTDPKGDILARILNAFIPVCGGINLEYYFSRVSPEVYGAGTKLPHNVVGLIGVSNGVNGDLRTGLPTQMTEVHDPLRLLVLVEQSPEVALNAATRNPSVFEWVKNEWVRYGCISPKDGRIYLFQYGSFQPWMDPGLPVKSHPTSKKFYEGQRDNVRFGLIEKDGGGRS